MDQITRSLLSDFVVENGLSTLPDSSQFEHFSGYLVTQKHHAEVFQTEDISIGDGGDIGIDCLAIMVNGSFITEPEEIDDLVEANGYLDVTFVFLQAETSSSFDTMKIGQFGFGVVDFFAEIPKLKSNERIKHFRKIWEKMLEHSRLFRPGNPQIYLYYVTTGKWIGDNDLVTRRDAVTKDIGDLGLFRNVTFECLGANEIQILSRQSKNAISAEITFAVKTVIPEIPRVQEAYLGLLPALEFLKLIKNDSGEIRTSIFYDNVRHWQEWNAVNKEISETVSTDKKILFPLLNNGVTIVAKRVHSTGNKFVIEDYQIVNGCQTSFVLYHNQAHCNDSVMIPLRLIATQDEEIKNSIIHATNRQTQVSDDQFFALTEFTKKLEAYFPTFEANRKLFYERRPGQYNSVIDIERVRMVNMTMLVRAFSSIFLALPHRTTRNYKALLQRIGNDIFNPEHRVEPYYVAAFSNYRMEYFFRNQTLGADLKPARYHLLLALRLVVAGIAFPQMNSREMQKYCANIMEVLWDNDRCRKAFEDAAALIRKIAAGNMDGDNVRTEAFTDALIMEVKVSEAGAGAASPAKQGK